MRRLPITHFINLDNHAPDRAINRSVVGNGQIRKGIVPRTVTDEFHHREADLQSKLRIDELRLNATAERKQIDGHRKQANDVGRCPSDSSPFPGIQM